VLAEIESQTGGLFKKENFVSSGCENALCSFHGDFILMQDGSLNPLMKDSGSCCCKRGDRETVIKARSYVANRWELREITKCCNEKSGMEEQTGDGLLERLRNYRLSVTCMAFQDAYNLDLERLKDCCLHVMSGSKLIPFCAYNLTSTEGYSFYRKSLREEEQT
jgi:uncharacterized radical SAM superfamily Fe-S cluster-containing enzyme